MVSPSGQRSLVGGSGEAMKTHNPAVNTSLAHKAAQGRLPSCCSMKYLVSFLLLWVISGNLWAEELTKSQCETVGGTLTKAGCLMLDESGKAKYGNSKTYMPDKKECNYQGGTWNEEYGCMAKISEEQCVSLGGKMQVGVGCVKQLQLPQEKCKELGGTLNESGGCALNRDLTLRSSGTAQKRAVP
jgi:hypothetical protein